MESEKRREGGKLKQRWREESLLTLSGCRGLPTPSLWFAREGKNLTLDKDQGFHYTGLKKLIIEMR